MMPAYMSANVHVPNAEKAVEYGRQVAATFEQYGGPAEVVEGAGPLHYLVLVEFPALAQDL